MCKWFFFLSFLLHYAYRKKASGLLIRVSLCCSSYLSAISPLSSVSQFCYRCNIQKTSTTGFLCSQQTWCFWKDKTHQPEKLNLYKPSSISNQGSCKTKKKGKDVCNRDANSTFYMKMLVPGNSFTWSLMSFRLRLLNSYLFQIIGGLKSNLHRSKEEVLIFLYLLGDQALGLWKTPTDYLYYNRYK